jgi:hypothetical protein
MSTLAIVACTIAMGWAQAPKAHPDFAGVWLFDEPATGEVATVERKGSAIFGEWFSVRQDAKFLTFEITIAKGMAPVQAVYALDGSETQNTSPPQAPGGAPIIVTAAARWVGEKLVVESRSQQPGGTGKGDPKVINIVSRRTIWLDKNGKLVIDRDGTPKPLVPTTRSVYKKQ